MPSDEAFGVEQEEYDEELPIPLHTPSDIPDEAPTGPPEAKRAKLPTSGGKGSSNKASHSASTTPAYEKKVKSRITHIESRVMDRMAEEFHSLKEVREKENDEALKMKEVIIDKTIASKERIAKMQFDANIELAKMQAESQRMQTMMFAAIFAKSQGFEIPSFPASDVKVGTGAAASNNAEPEVNGTSKANQNM